MAISKGKATSKEIRKLNKVLKQVPEDRKAIAEKLIKEIVFIAKTLDELKETVETFGTTELFKQGKQEFMRESPALKAYNTTIQRYSLLYKQLTDLLPKSQQDTAEDVLLKFMKQR